MEKFASVLALMLAVLVASTYDSAADPLKPGDVLTYAVTTSWSEMPAPDSKKRKASVESAKLPEMARSTSGTVILTIDRIDADGSAHGSIPIANDKRIPGGSASSFEASVMPDGQILPKVDFAMIRAAGFDQNPNNPVLPPGYRPRTSAEWTNIAAFIADRRLQLFNDVALGASKKKVIKEGDAWRIVIADQNNQMVNFVGQGTQHLQGHEVAVIALTTTRMTQNGVGPVSGTAFYDLQNHILVKLHVVGDNDTVLGVRNQTLDIVLQ